VAKQFIFAWQEIAAQLKLLAMTGKGYAARNDGVVAKQSIFAWQEIAASLTLLAMTGKATLLAMTE
jgi:hypothetical protein